MPISHRLPAAVCLLALMTSGASAQKKKAKATETAEATQTAPATGAEATQAADWLQWRGPFQNGVAAEHYKNAIFQKEPLWSYDTSGRGTPVVADGKVFSSGYRGVNQELVEVLSCLDLKTGQKVWEHEFQDFLSDTVYNRYTIGAPTVDPENKRVYALTTFGVFSCYDFEGKLLWQHSLMETKGRLTFPNAKVGSVVLEGDLAIVRGITANWGAEGPAADRFYAFDKVTGEQIYSTQPGTTPPQDNSFSTLVIETRDGKRVGYAGTGDGNVVCFNVRNGKPYWRFPLGKVGVNASVSLAPGNLLVCNQGDENIDSSEVGRTVAIRLPEKLMEVPEALDLGKAEDCQKAGVALGPKNNAEVWRNGASARSSSTVVLNNDVFLMGETGVLNCLDLATGATKWVEKLDQLNVHASPLAIDGLLYVPIYEGGLAVVDPKAEKDRVKHRVKLEGNCIGAPAVSGGTVLLHTTARLYAFAIKNSGITTDKAAAPEMPATGKPVALQIIPNEVALASGGKAAFRIRSIDAAGFPVAEVKEVKWESFIPPTARVKSNMDGTFNAQGELVAGAKSSGGAFKATTADGLAGTIRGRVLPALPYKEDFESFEPDQDDPREPGAKYAYPPLPWMGARFKVDVRQMPDGNKVLAKNMDYIFFQRALTFINSPELSNYTLQADVMTDGNKRVKSDVGLINQRYLITLKGNANNIEVSSNYERLVVAAPFKIEANKWYTLKTHVEAKADGSGTVHGKAWPKGEPEPDAWTITVPVPRVHAQGAPGLFAFTSQNQKKVYLDNILLTPNQK